MHLEEWKERREVRVTLRVVESGRATKCGCGQGSKGGIIRSFDSVEGEEDGLFPRRQVVMRGMQVIIITHRLQLIPLGGD